MNVYSEIAITLIPIQSGFTPRDQAALDRITGEINDQLSELHLRALYRVPPVGTPIERIQLQCFDDANRTVSHTRANGIRSYFLDLPWVGEVEVLGICRV